MLPRSRSAHPQAHLNQRQRSWLLPDRGQRSSRAYCRISPDSMVTRSARHLCHASPFLRTGSAQCVVAAAMCPACTPVSGTASSRMPTGPRCVALVHQLFTSASTQLVSLSSSSRTSPGLQHTSLRARRTQMALTRPAREPITVTSAWDMPYGPQAASWRLQGHIEPSERGVCSSIGELSASEADGCPCAACRRSPSRRARASRPGNWGLPTLLPRVSNYEPRTCGFAGLSASASCALLFA
jgi:hypothetical protein